VLEHNIPAAAAAAAAAAQLQWVALISDGSVWHS